MKTEQEYVKDLSEIRSMMERSTKFLSLSGLSGIMAGIYALIGAYIAHRYFFTSAGGEIYSILAPQEITKNVYNLIFLAVLILVLALGTAVILSSKKAAKNDEVLWNPVTRRLVINMAIPLIAGGILILILISKGSLGLIAPLTMIFYGVSLINASEFTFNEIRYLGILQIVLGLLSSYFMELSLLFWALGFGLMHIAYGLYMHLKYEK